MLNLILLICDVEPMMNLPFFINVEPFIYMKISFICDFPILRNFFHLYVILRIFYLTSSTRWASQS
jgi:hypothetical protein